MAITIGSNLDSLKIQRKLARSTSDLSNSYERLASGQRINRASDDAAGLAVADELRAQSKIYGKAISNANDGLSIMSIAEAALLSQIDILTRLQELAEQSANGTFSAIQREALSREYLSLQEEYVRIGKTTEFNGVSFCKRRKKSRAVY